MFNQQVLKEQTICVYSRRNFGPVVALTTFSSTENIAIANDTPMV
jgi:acyl-CoA reductase-like NAD-dependent aldehyde dehydrogenase